MTVSHSEVQTSLGVPVAPGIAGLCVTTPQTVLTFLPSSQLWKPLPGPHPVHEGGQFSPSTLTTGGASLLIPSLGGCQPWSRKQKSSER